MELNNTTVLNIYVLTWMDSNSTYFPNGVPRQINCNHQNVGIFGVNIKGEVFPLPNTTVVPPTPVESPPITPTDWQQQTTLEREGNVFGKPYPFATGDSAFKICNRLKDLQTGITYYVDAVDYLAKLPGCNLVAYNTT
jgi:hypothetical protein